MKVKLKTLMAGPRGIYQRGSIIETDKGTAQHLVETGQGVIVGGDAEERPTVSEAATDAETATKRRVR